MKDIITSKVTDSGLIIEQPAILKEKTNKLKAVSKKITNALRISRKKNMAQQTVDISSQYNSSDETKNTTGTESYSNIVNEVMESSKEEVIVKEESINAVDNVNKEAERHETNDKELLDQTKELVLMLQKIEMITKFLASISIGEEIDLDKIEYQELLKSQFDEIEEGLEEIDKFEYNIDTKSLKVDAPQN